MIQTHPDALCRDILQRHAEGSLTSIETRQQLVEVLHKSGIAASVAGEKLNQTVQFRHDMAAEMELLIYTKMMQETGGGFDLEIGLQCSVTGWARSLLRAARTSIARNILNRSIDKEDLVDPTPPASALSASQQTTPLFSSTAHKALHTARAVTSELTAAQEQGNAMLIATDWLRSKNRHLRDNSRLAAEAAAFTYSFGVPQLIRFRLLDRKRLKAQLVKDPSLAYRSVKEMYAIVGSETVTDPVPDNGFLALWDDFSFDHLEAIVETDPKVALTLVDAALSDRARPSRTVLTSFNASVRALGTGKGWRRLAAEVAESFIALEFEAYSSFDTTGAEYRAEKVAGRKIACMKSSAVFARALAHPGQRLGLTEEDMYDQLERLICELTEFDVKETAA